MPDFLPDGRVRISVEDDDAIVLKRPKYGQYRRYQLVLSEVRDEMEKARQEFANQAADSPDRAAEVAQALNDTIAGATIRWWRLVVDGDDETKGLGDKKLPASDDDLPVELIFGRDVTQILRVDSETGATIHPGVVGAVMEHWFATPLPSGAGTR
jgi:hypothetical protein